MHELSALPRLQPSWLGMQVLCAAAAQAPGSGMHAALGHPGFDWWCRQLHKCMRACQKLSSPGLCQCAQRTTLTAC